MTPKHYDFAPKIVDLLIESGADTSLENAEGYTSHFLAVKNRREPVWRALEKHGVRE